MNAFYDYLAELEPRSAAKKRDIRRCTKQVLGSMKPQPKLRRRFRIALVCSVVLLTVCTVIPVMQSFADRPDWRDTYEFMTPLPIEQLDANMDAVREILQETAVSTETEGYTLTLDSYATDGIAGIAFVTLTVPEGFDWKYPYLGISKQTVIENGVEDRNDGYFAGTALTPSGQPNQYRAEIAFWDGRYNEPQDRGRTLILQSMELRDEYFDFTEGETGYYVYSENPNRIVFIPQFAVSLDCNEQMLKRQHTPFGDVSVTPFGVYLQTDGMQKTAENFSVISNTIPEIMMKDGTILSSVNHVPHSLDNTVIYGGGGDDARFVPDLISGAKALVRYPIDISQVAAIRFAKEDRETKEVTETVIPLG